jgi:2-amino-4-hydroxy-6-hydroxymethyldihydropteridine diphosphokinase
MIVLGLGSNIGNRLKYLNDACFELSRVFGGPVAVSSVYETQGWGVKDHPDYLNAAICFNCDVTPEKTLQILHSIEKSLGRERKQDEILPRTIDIDLLFYDNLIIKNQQLIIPHPRIKYRKFVLLPLCEIMADFIHPECNQSIRELTAQCEDESGIEKTTYLINAHEL